MGQQNQYDAALPERLAAEENARKEERIPVVDSEGKRTGATITASEAQKKQDEFIEKWTPNEPAIAEKAKLESLKEKAYGEKASETGATDTDKTRFAEVSSLIAGKAKEMSEMRRAVDSDKKWKGGLLSEADYQKVEDQWKVLDKEYTELENKLGPEEAEKAVAGRQNFEKRYFELADAMKKKASEMNGLDSQDVSYREKEQQWNSMRQKSFDLESKMGGIPEQPKKQEKSFWAKMQNAIRSGFWINKIR